MLKFFRFSFSYLLIVLVLFSSYFLASAQSQTRLKDLPAEPKYPGMITQVDEPPPGVTPEWWATISGEILAPTSVDVGDFPSPDLDWVQDGYSSTYSSSFGKAIASAGDVNNDGYEDVIVGDPTYFNNYTGQGRAYVYLGSENGLNTSYVWTFGDTDWDGNARFGLSAGTAGDFNCDGYDDIIIGAPRYTGSYSQQGYAKVFFGNSSGLNSSAGWTVYGSATSEQYGSGVSTAGDVNGDNCDDIIVGAKYWYDGSSGWYEGAAFVYYGSETPDTTFDWMVQGNQSGTELGEFLDTVGDVNGDGYDDIIVAAPYYDYVGKVWGYYGSPSGLSGGALSSSPDWTITVKARSVSKAGDVNGDGYDDVIIGNDDTTAFVYQGSASGLSTTVNWSTDCGVGYDNYFTNVSEAGDVNDDGYDDVLVALSTYPYSQHTGPEQNTKEGYVYLFYGSSSGLLESPTWSMSGGEENAYLGDWEGLGAADVNDDNYADVLMGAPGYPGDGALIIGRGYAVYGRADEAISGLTAVNNSPQEIDETVNFTATKSSGSYVMYDWDFGDGITDANAGSTTEHSYSAAGIFSTTVIAYNTVNTQTTTTLVTVQDIPIEGLEATSSSPTALGALTYFTATISSGTGVSYTWNLGGEAIEYGEVVSHTFSTTGEFSVVVTATNTTNQQVAETFAHVDVPILGLAATNDSPTLSGELTTLTATVTGGTGVNYQWWVDGETKDGSVVTHAYSEAGEHTAIVTATNHLGFEIAETQILVGEVVELSPGTESFSTLQDSLSLDFPSPLTETMTITVTPQFTPTQDTGWFTFLGMSFDLSMEDADGNPIIEISPTITLTLYYDNIDIPQHIDESELTLQRYDEVLGDWVELTTINRDIEENWIMVELDHLTEFAILSYQPYKIYLPLVFR